MASLALPVVRSTRRTVHQVAASLASRASVFSATPSSSSSPSPTSLGAAIPSTSSFTLSLSLAPTAAPAPAAPSSSALATLAALIPDSLAAGLRELLPPWVFAVPKRRTTHGAKRMRASNKGLKEKQNLVACPSCGAPKLAHHLCHGCHVSFRRELHREAKEAKTGLAPEHRA
ncbi:hypothetical protein JCM8208_005704 [Rhodotorula glutinis]